MLLVEHEVYLWVGKVLLLLVDVTLLFCDVVRQHLQPRV